MGPLDDHLPDPHSPGNFLRLPRPLDHSVLPLDGLAQESRPDIQLHRAESKQSGRQTANSCFFLQCFKLVNSHFYNFHLNIDLDISAHLGCGTSFRGPSCVWTLQPRCISCILCAVLGTMVRCPCPQPGGSSPWCA